MLHFQRCARLKFVSIIAICLVCFNEFITFTIKIQSWPYLKKSESSIDILLVADPQILSSQTEPYFPFSLFAIWDANRYVSRSFQYAIQHVQPDVVVFLGDLLNDGSVSNKEEFYNLASYFKQLMPIPDTAKALYIPGDNDIGGEGNDLISEDKIKRFNKAFHASGSLSVDFIDFYHFNALDVTEIDDSQTDQTIRHGNVFNIVASHVNIMPSSLALTRRKLGQIEPNLVLSAHNHDSWYFIGPKTELKATQFLMFRDEGEILELDLNGENLYEISVPTCSYRMGKKSYGFGYLNIETDGKLRYSVLWLPSRMISLVVYLISACFCLSLLIWPAISYFLHKNEDIPLHDSIAKYHRI